MADLYVRNARPEDADRLTEIAHQPTFVAAEVAKVRGFYRRMGARRVDEVPSTPAGRMLPLLVVDLGEGENEATPVRPGQTP
jgi:hypothetical protein